MFLDLAWGGTEGQVTYPPFVNRKAVRTVLNPDGQLILRQHDTQQLTDTLRRVRRPDRRRNSSSQYWASVQAYKCPVRCIVSPKGPMAKVLYCMA